jgi:protein-S-isoprenylcysteine O-methyltransferase Ste14
VNPVRWAWLAAVLLPLLGFADSARLTFGAAFLARRSRARLALGLCEAGAVAAWAVARYAGHLDRALVPRPLAAAAALVGLGLTAAGAGLAAWAKWRLGRWFSMTFGVKPGHELVTDGPYAIVRHPIYTGLLAALAGSALVWDSALTLALGACFAVTFTLHTRAEEALFAAHFGPAFAAYRRRVPRLLPWPRRRAG